MCVLQYNKGGPNLTISCNEGGPNLTPYTIQMQDHQQMTIRTVHACTLGNPRRIIIHHRPQRPFRLSSLPSPHNHPFPRMPMVIHKSQDFMKTFVNLQHLHVGWVTAVQVFWVTHKPSESQKTLHDIAYCFPVGHSGQAPWPHVSKNVSVEFVSRIMVSFSSAVIHTGPRNLSVGLDCTEIAHELKRTSVTVVVWPHLLELCNQTTITWLLTIPCQILMEDLPKLN